MPHGANARRERQRAMCAMLGQDPPPWAVQELAAAAQSSNTYRMGNPNEENIAAMSANYSIMTMNSRTSSRSCGTPLCSETRTGRLCRSCSQCLQACPPRRVQPLARRTCWGAGGDAHMSFSANMNQKESPAWSRLTIGFCSVCRHRTRKPGNRIRETAHAATARCRRNTRNAGA